MHGRLWNNDPDAMRLTRDGPLTDAQVRPWLTLVALRCDPPFLQVGLSCPGGRSSFLAVAVPQGWAWVRGSGATEPDGRREGFIRVPVGLHDRQDVRMRFDEARRHGMSAPRVPRDG